MSTLHGFLWYGAFKNLEKAQTYHMYSAFSAGIIWTTQPPDLCWPKSDLMLIKLVRYNIAVANIRVGFYVVDKNGGEYKYGKESYELLNLQFVPDGCRKCSLYMGEGADLAAGDAWLNSYPQLTALLVRNKTGEQAVLDSFKRGSIRLFSIP